MPAMQVEALYVSPVKSFGLTPVTSAEVTPDGLAGDRAFIVVDERGRVVTQREWPQMALLRAEYDPPAGVLRLLLRDAIIEDAVTAGAPDEGDFYSIRIPSFTVEGPFAAAISRCAGRPLRLLKVASGGAFDAYPVSLCTRASVERVAQAAGVARVDERRFRQNIYISGAQEAHAEDRWIGRDVRIGSAAVRPAEPDGRCVLTTIDPATAEQDLDTLGVIASYRTDEPKAVNFGMYCTVTAPGAIAVGDAVTPLEHAEAPR
jgi:uncharacterized protein YcbX